MTDDIDFAKVTFACLGKNTLDVYAFKNKKNRWSYICKKTS